MAEPSRISASELDEPGLLLLESAVERLERAWTLDPHPVLAEFLPPCNEPGRTRVLIELIKVDLECAWKSGQKRTLEDYVRDWPELRDDPDILVELLGAECTTRAEFDAIPTPEDLRARFPDVWDRIDLAGIQNQMANERRSGSGVAAEHTPADTSKVTAEHTPPGGDASLPLRVGQRFGRYEIRGVLGQGGMGTVYRVHDTRLKREVALKTPRFDPAVEPGIGERFVRESEAAAGLRHGNLCAIYDAGRIDDTYYITMDLIEGQSLADRMKERAVDSREAAELSRKLASALDKVHKANIVHRDIKPSNVMIDEDGEPFLMDFGLARHTQHESRLTSRGVVPGTFAYMAPECVNGRPADARSDIYGLGVLLYEMLTGRLPFEGPTPTMLVKISRSKPPRPRRLRGEIDPVLETICLRAMAKQPADRYQSAGELAEALARHLQGAPRATGPPPRRRRWVRGVAASVAGVLFLLLAVVIIFRNVGPFTSKPVSLPIVRWIPTDSKVACIQLSTNGSTLYAACARTEEPYHIRVFDIDSGELLQTIDSPDPTYERKRIALSADDRYVYATNYFRRDISRIDLQDHNARTDLIVGGVPTSVWAHDIGITPDDRKVVVALGQDGRSKDENNDQISIVDSADGEFSLVGEVRLDDEPAMYQIGFSSDSRHAYIITRRRKSAAPKLYEIGLTPPYRVTRTVAFPGGELCDIAVSNELNRAFISDRGRRVIHVVDLETFKPVFSFGLENHKPGCLAMSNRGDLLAVLCPATRMLFCVDPRDGTIVGKASGLRRNPSDVKFSTDDRRLFVAHVASRGGIAVVDLGPLITPCTIVFASDRPGESYQIYVMDADGGNVRRLTDNHATDRSPRWSPDGRRIAFVSDLDGPRRIHVVNPRGELLSILKRTDPVHGNDNGTPLDWSPDGRRIAFVGNGNKAVRVVDVSTGEVQTLIDGTVGRGCSHHRSLCWSRSDDTIVFLSQHPANAYHQGLFAVDPKTKEVRRLVDARDGSDRYVTPAASPDGTQFAVVRFLGHELRPHDLALLGAYGQGLTSLVGISEGTCTTPRWFPDGGRLVYSAGTEDFRHIHVVDAGGGEPHRLTHGDWQDVEPDVCGGLLAIPAAATPTP